MKQPPIPSRKAQVLNPLSPSSDAKEEPALIERGVADCRRHLRGTFRSWSAMTSAWPRKVQVAAITALVYRVAKAHPAGWVRMPRRRLRKPRRRSDSLGRRRRVLPNFLAGSRRRSDHATRPACRCAAAGRRKAAAAGEPLVRLPRSNCLSCSLSCSASRGRRAAGPGH